MLVEYTDGGLPEQIRIKPATAFIESCFEAIQSQLKLGYANRMPFTRREITQEELEKLKQEVMQKFQVTSGRKKNICVNEAVCGVCDAVINTDKLSPADVAKKILDF